MSSAKEPGCSQLQDLRSRLERLKESWESLNLPKSHWVWTEFQEDWRDGWQRIEEMLSDIESRLGRRLRGKVWDRTQPAILRFPPLEESVALMGPC